MTTRIEPPPSTAEAPATVAAPGPRATGRNVAIGAAILIGLQAALRAWIGYRGYYFLDDFAFTGRAAQHSIFDVNGYLLEPYNSHLMPAAFAEVWILTKLWPLQFGVVATVDMALQALVSFAFYRLLRALFGTRPVILVPLAFFVFTPITLAASTWWAAALNQLPQQLAMITALLCQTHYLRTGRAGRGMLGALAVLGGLLFSEKTLLAVPLVAAYTLLFFVDGNLGRRFVHGWRQHWRVWLAYLVVAVPYTVYYALAVPSPSGSTGDGGALLQLLGAAFGHALAPGLLGGPWGWAHIGSAGGIAAPGTAASWIAGTIVVGVLIATIVLYRRAWYGWAFGLGYAFLDLAVLAVSRATFVGPLIGDEFRYVTDVALVAVLGASLAVLRPVGTWVHPPLAVERRQHPMHRFSTPLLRDIGTLLPRLGTTAVVGLLVVGVAASSTVSTLRFDAYWSINPARPYLTHLRQDLPEIPASAKMFDQEVPGEVAWALLYPYNRLSRMLAPLPDRPQFLELGGTATALAVPDQTGRVRWAQVVGFPAVPGKAPLGCGYRLGSRPVRVPLVKRTIGWTWVVHMAYIASADATATLHVGRTTTHVTFERGLHQLFVEVTGSIDAVYVSALDTAATVCTNSVTVGQVQPIPGTAP